MPSHSASRMQPARPHSWKFLFCAHKMCSLLYLESFWHHYSSFRFSLLRRHALLLSLNLSKSSLDGVHPVDQKRNDRLVYDAVTARQDTGLVTKFLFSLSSVTLDSGRYRLFIWRALLTDLDSTVNTGWRLCFCRRNVLAPSMPQEQCNASFSEQARWDSPRTCSKAKWVASLGTGDHFIPMISTPWRSKSNAWDSKSVFVCFDDTSERTCYDKI